MKALKCKMLGTELVMHTVGTYTVRLTLLDKSRQMNLPHGNFNELKMAHLAVQNKKNTITWERKLYSEIHHLKTFGVHQRLDW